MNYTDFEDNVDNFKQYVEEICVNDTWLKHQKQLADKGINTIDSIEQGQLYLVLDNSGNVFYYYYPSSGWSDSEKKNKGIGFMIYVPTEYLPSGQNSYIPKDYRIYYEPVTDLQNYSILLTKIEILRNNQLINWNELPWGGK